MKDTLGDNCPGFSGLKVLGIQWKPMTNELCFDMGHVCDAAGKIEPTKQNVISVALRFYDPLGVLSPFTVRFKILFQELCMKEVGWDEPLSGELITRWRGLLKSLKST